MARHNEWLEKKNRNGGIQWFGRWREEGTNGRIVKHSILLGPTKKISKAQAYELLKEEKKKRPTTIPALAISAPLTFRDYVKEYWMPSYLTSYQESTKQQLCLSIENYLLPAFGDQPIGAITRSQVQQFFGTVAHDCERIQCQHGKTRSCPYRDRPLSPDTKHTLRRHLHRIMACVIDDNHRSDNPATKIKIGRSRRRVPPSITPVQFQLLLDNVSPRVNVLILTAMLTSMRLSELLGLRWECVNFDQSILTVKETYYRGAFAQPKTQRSERQVPMGSALKDALTVWHSQQSRRGPKDLVFCSKDGMPLRDRMLLKQLHNTCKRVGLPRLSWHLFRHLHGTLLSHLGVPVAVTQAQLGHADPRITLGIYTHILPGAQRQAVASLETYLLPPNAPQNGQKPTVVAGATS